MSSGADLFVVCKTCGSEVSAYITECPYCGNRLRKRAPKLDKAGAAPRPARRPALGRLGRGRARLGRLRPGEMPGIRFAVRPYASMALLVASVLVGVAWRAGALSRQDIKVLEPLGAEWWRVLTAPFLYENEGYMLCALVGIGLFGWLLERRHGHWAPLLVFLAGGAGGMLAAVLTQGDAVAQGGSGAALAMLGAWVVPDLRQRRRGGESDSDLIGVAVIAVVLLLLPLATQGEANPVAGPAGGVIGLLLGLALARVSRES